MRTGVVFFVVVFLRSSPRARFALRARFAFAFVRLNIRRKITPVLQAPAF